MSKRKIQNEAELRKALIELCGKTSFGNRTIATVLVILADEYQTLAYRDEGRVEH